MPRGAFLAWCSLCPRPSGSPRWPRPSRTAGSFGSVSWVHCSFPLGLGACKFCLWPSRRVFFSHSSESPIIKSHWSWRSDSLRIHSPFFEFPGLEDWDSEPSQQRQNFFCIIVLQFVGHPPRGYGIWFYCGCAPSTISLLFLLRLWTWGIFGGFPCRPVDGHSAAHCSFGALGGGERTSFYPTVLNQHVYRFLTVDLRCPLKRAELESLS